MPETRFKSWHEDLLDLLGLGVPPIGIAFLSEIPGGVRRIERAMPPPTPDGRTGAVAALGEIIGMAGTPPDYSRDGTLTAIVDYVKQVFDKIDKVAAPQSQI